MLELSADKSGSPHAAGWRPRIARLTAVMRQHSALLVVILVSAAVYANTLQNGFVYDDAWQVLGNSWIRDIRFIPDILTSDVWKFSGDMPSNYYRPVMYLLYMAVYYLFGLAPWAFHLLNLLLNVLVCVMVYLTAAMLFRQFRPSAERWVLPVFAAALLFATHPVHTEAVAWIASVPELTYSLFCLLSLYFYARSRDGEGGYYALSVAAFSVALFCKEPALLFPLVLLAYDLCLGALRGQRALSLRRYLPYAVAGAAYLTVRGLALGHIVQTVKYHEVDAYRSVISIFPLFGAYLGKLLWPVPLNAYTVFTPISSILTGRGLVGILVTLAFLAILAFSARRRPLAFLALVLIAVPLLPALYIPGLPANLFAERYLYLPTFGFVLLIADLLAQIGGDTRRHTAAAGAFVLAVAALYAAGTVTRNAVWRDEVSFYKDVLKKSPDVAMMHVNLGWTYFRMGRSSDALREYEKALELKPDLADAHNNRGMVYERQNLLTAAINEYREAIALEPEYPSAHANLGNAYMRLGNADQAIAEYQAALRLSPRFATAHYNLGNAYAKSGLLNEAVGAYRSAIELRPDEVDYHTNLGVAYIRLNRFDLAMEAFERAVRLDPDNLSARQNFEMARRQMGL